MLILNLGCGTKTSPACVNIDWSMYLRLRRNALLQRLAPMVLTGERKQRFRSLPDSLVVHDLRKGIPAETGTVDVVYHSHVLEHIDRDAAPGFQREILRVLKPGGIQRIVVPDLEVLCTRYLADFTGRVVADDHDEHVADMIEQMVRRESSGTAGQPPVRRKLENLFMGDARRRGETHQWMYDRISLPALVERCGFVDPKVHDYDTSDVPAWNDIGLDLAADGGQYKPMSIYLECRKATS
jgi:SAM-dependent methyltransferase